MGMFASLFGSDKRQENTTYNTTYADSGNVAVSKTTTLENAGNVQVNLGDLTRTTGISNAGGFNIDDKTMMIAAVALLVVAFIFLRKG